LKSDFFDLKTLCAKCSQRFTNLFSFCEFASIERRLYRAFLAIRFPILSPIRYIRGAAARFYPNYLKLKIKTSNNRKKERKNKIPPAGAQKNHKRACFFS
jgi:hypothetical protein